MDPENNESRIKPTGLNYWNQTGMTPREGQLAGTPIRTPNGEPVAPTSACALERLMRASISRAPLLLGAAHQLHDSTGISPDLIAPTLLAGGAVAVQTVADFKIGEQIQASAGCSVLIIGPSGVGKSTIGKVAFRPVEEYSKRLNDLVADGLRKYEADMEVWAAHKKALVRAITKHRIAGCATEALDEALRNHISETPVRPLSPSILISNSTPEGIARTVAGNSCGVAVVNSEGAQFLVGRGAAGLPLYTALLSGENYHYPLSGKNDGFDIVDPRYTMYLAAQPEFVAAFNLARGKNAKAIGYYPRTLIFRVRMPNLARGEVSAEPLEDVVRWSARITSLLEQGYANFPKPATRTVVALDESAIPYWKSIVAEIQRLRGKGGRYYKFQDHAARLAEVIMRVATIIHVVEGFDGGISEDTLELAVIICAAASEEYLLIFNNEPGMEEIADILMGWLQKNYEGKKRMVSTSYIANRVPLVCQKENFHPAIDRLRQRGVIDVQPFKNAKFIDLMPGAPIPDGELFWEKYAVLSDK